MRILLSILFLIVMRIFTKIQFDKLLVDGGWTDWSVWGPCSNVCGPGNMTRDRSCTNPVPQNNGTDCTGVDTETVICTGPCSGRLKVSYGFSCFYKYIKFVEKILQNLYTNECNFIR